MNNRCLVLLEAEAEMDNRTNNPKTATADDILDHRALSQPPSVLLQVRVDDLVLRSRSWRIASGETRQQQ